MFHLLLLPSLALAVRHSTDQEIRQIVEKLHGVVAKQGGLIEELARTVSDQSDHIDQLELEHQDQETEIRILRHRLKGLHRKLGDLQWDSIHTSASAACSHLKPSMTKTVLPFVEEVSCGMVCAASNTRFTKCVAMIRFNVMRTGRMVEAVPFGEIWVREDACRSSSYTLGTELLKEDTLGYYSVCCCGL